MALFRAPHGRNTLVATLLATTVLFAYWGLFTWLPGFLNAPRAQGGAGMTIVRTSGFVFAVQIGAFFGYLGFGVLADRFGRRPAFAGYVLMAAALVPLYGLAPDYGEHWLLILGPLVGFFGTGFFSLFGAMLAELYPTEIRGSGQGFVYNIGRGLSALAPFVVGASGGQAWPRRGAWAQCRILPSGSWNCLPSPGDKERGTDFSSIGCDLTGRTIISGLKRSHGHRRRRRPRNLRSCLPRWHKPRIAAPPSQIRNEDNGGPNLHPTFVAVARKGDRTPHSDTRTWA